MRFDSHVCFSHDHPPEHLEAILKRNRFDGAVLVVDGPEFPATGPHIAAIVLRHAASDGHWLDACQQDPRFRGICASLAEIRPELPAELAHRGLTLDVEMRPHQFPALLDLAARRPDLRIAVDHLARPAFARGLDEAWLRGMEAAAESPRIFVKISGLLAEASLPWSSAPLQPYVERVLALFGPARLMFGSEWPVRLPDITWKEGLAAFTQAIGARSIEVREQLLGATASAFYHLPA